MKSDRESLECNTVFEEVEEGSTLEVSLQNSETLAELKCPQTEKKSFKT